jgi:hypothetical protein
MRETRWIGDWGSVKTLVIEEYYHCIRVDTKFRDTNFRTKIFSPCTYIYFEPESHRPFSISAPPYSLRRQK